MFAEAGTTIEIRPRSAKLYVQPDGMVITVPSQIESCLTDVRFDALGTYGINFTCFNLFF